METITNLRGRSILSVSFREAALLDRAQLHYKKSQLLWSRPRAITYVTSSLVLSFINTCIKSLADDGSNKQPSSWSGKGHARSEFPVSSAHESIKSARKKGRQGEKSQGRQSERGKQEIYLVATLLDPRTKMTKMLSFCDNKYFPSSWKDEGHGFLSMEFKIFISSILREKWIIRMYTSVNLALWMTTQVSVAHQWMSTLLVPIPLEAWLHSRCDLAQASKVQRPIDESKPARDEGRRSQHTVQLDAWLRTLRVQNVSWDSRGCLHAIFKVGFLLSRSREEP